ncbi:unnamed protein product [Phytomonas sp. EM1]|nr:unnamed protein product [Phytomonas sp. EM1]|eukprot:CCW64154.1 unnamed protein product [Phytomonas sp. isolate EM1]
MDSEKISLTQKSILSSAMLHVDSDSQLDTDKTKGKEKDNIGNFESNTPLRPAIVKQEEDIRQDDYKQPQQEVHPSSYASPMWPPRKCVHCDYTNTPIEKGTNALGISLSTSAHTVPSIHAFHSHRLGSTLAGMSSSTASIVTFSHTGGHLLTKATKTNEKDHNDALDTVARLKDAYSLFSTPTSLHILMPPDISVSKAVPESELPIQPHHDHCKLISEGKEERPKNFSGSRECSLECCVKADKDRQEAQVSLEAQDAHTCLCTLTGHPDESSQKISSEATIPEKNVNLYPSNLEGSTSDARKTVVLHGECYTPRNSSSYRRLEDFVEKQRSPTIMRIMKRAVELTLREMLESS